MRRKIAMILSIALLFVGLYICVDALCTHVDLSELIEMYEAQIEERESVEEEYQLERYLVLLRMEQVRRIELLWYRLCLALALGLLGSLVLFKEVRK